MYDSGGAKRSSASDNAWSPDGTRIAAYPITDVRRGGKIVLIDVPERLRH